MNRITKWVLTIIVVAVITIGVGKGLNKLVDNTMSQFSILSEGIQ